MQIRVDEEDPLDRPGGDGGDDGIQDGGARPDGAEAAEEEHDAGEQQRIAREVERVGHRRDGRLLVKGDLVVARDRVCDDVAQEARGEEPPRQATPVEPLRADEDRTHGGEADQDVEDVLRVSREQEIDPDRDPADGEERQGAT